MNNKKQIFSKGMKNGIPIMLGYFTVSFTFGIQARDIGLSLLDATLISLTNLTSAGQFAGIKMISARSSYIEMAISQFIINSRYLLMSSSLSQKIDPNSSFFERAGMAFGTTDEIYSLAISSSGVLSPYYVLGMMAVAIPGWTLGTFFGVILGNILSANVISALNIALYAMLISAIIPASRSNKIIGLVIFLSMITSYLFNSLPYLNNLSSGFQIIIISLLLTSVFAILFPIKENTNE